MADNPIQIKITNLDRLKMAFNKAPFLMKRELNEAIKKTLITVQAGEVLAYRELGIGVVTGGLIGSIERGIFMGDLYGEVGPNVTGSSGVGYAGFVHDGTRYMRARPYLTKAIDGNAETIDQFFTKAVDTVLSQIAGDI